jgi:hypothetical protein
VFVAGTGVEVGRIGGVVWGEVGFVVGLSVPKEGRAFVEVVGLD